MGKYKNEKRYTAPKGTAKKTKEQTMKSRKRKETIAAILIGAIMLGVPATMQYVEVKEAEKIESNAEIDVLRSFNDIKQDKMGKYLNNEIEKLYEKYPDLDNMIFEEGEIENKTEFANDIYRLYKALMVDKAEKSVENIDDVTVTAVDQIFVQSDWIKDGDERIAKTYVEKYKEITNSYVAAKEGNGDVKKFAKETYELLAVEFGLKENVLESEEIQKTIEKTGIYYDQERGIVYTKEGSGHIEFDKKNKEIEKNEEKEEGFEPGD